MNTDAWTNDAGHAADRIASLAPAEVHQAICQAAIDAIRAGLDAELLDGHVVTRADGLIGATRDRRNDRITHLDRELADARRRLDRARANANNEDDPDLAQEYRDDARRQMDRIRELQTERTRLADTGNDDLGATFDSGADYVAHALARLATIERDAHGTIGDALAHIVDFTDIDVSQPGVAHLEFHVKVPADGRVARLGPIRATVNNHAYRNTIAQDARGDVARELLARNATAHGLATRLRSSPHHVLVEVTETLQAHGFTQLAAGTAARSGLRPLYAVLAYHLWNEPLPADLDPAYVGHVLATYQNPDFAWNLRYHALDCTLRQHLIDAAVHAGGTITVADAAARLHGTGVDEIRITIFTRVQHLGDTPPWLPCLQRSGNWTRQAPRTGKHLTTITCPHCGGRATKAVRTPETPDGLLCPACRRTPRPGSPIYPADYLAL